MAETKIDLKKKVFSKSQYTKTIDTQFSELGVTTLQEDLASQIDTTQFFQLYNDLFYEIPSNGETNSHEFLVKNSGEYINFDQIAEEILALQQEIAGLREELLAEQIKVVELESGVTVNTGSLGLGETTDISNISTNINSGGQSSNSGGSNNVY